MRSWLDDLLFLVYPRYCPACGHGIPLPSSPFCLACAIALRPSGQHLLLENRFTERFWGRLPIHTGSALFAFVKGGRVQRLVHALKYAQRLEVGSYLGYRFGQCLAGSPHYGEVSCVVPVPLYWRRERERGFNQSVIFGRAVARGLGVPFYRRALRRMRHTQTQTRRSRQERWENVAGAFRLARPQQLAGRHVLLVDDVLTTGATLEACGGLILGLEETHLSLATLAMATE